jgi:hypothetical protein
MLNMFSKSSSVPLIEDVTPAPRLTSQHRKQLRWLINNPPQDLAKLMTVDADMAAVMLEHNQDDEWKNRPHSEKGMLRYVRSMQRGWKLTGEPVIFSKSGRLLNGQNRLMACVKAGSTFQTLVVFGIEDDAFKFMDIGIARTAGHIFSIEGIANCNAIAAAARLLYGYKAKTTWEGRAPDVENDALLAFYHRHDRLQDSMAHARHLYSELRVNPRWGAFLHYICAEKNRGEADAFFDKLASGVGIVNKTSTVYKLRKRIAENAMSTSTKIGEAHIGAYTIKAWNAHRRNETLGVLKWRTEQSPNESFPRAE